MLLKAVNRKFKHGNNYYYKEEHSLWHYTTWLCNIKEKIIHFTEKSCATQELPSMKVGKKKYVAHTCL
jgi:hypothetical protein